LADARTAGEQGREHDGGHRHRCGHTHRRHPIPATGVGNDERGDEARDHREQGWANLQAVADRLAQYAHRQPRAQHRECGASTMAASNGAGSPASIHDEISTRDLIRLTVKRSSGL